MSDVLHDGVSIIEMMSRNDFHQKYVRGICKTRSFGALVSFMAENISSEEKFEVRTMLARNGIPLSLTKSDDDLNTIAAAISARATSLK